jgi:ribonuclease HI
VETIEPIRHYPKWALDITQEIAEDIATAVKDDEYAEEDLRVYSDGSAVDGGVGGAAVLLRNGEVERTKRVYLGSDQEHTVYEGEMVGMILAIELLKEEGGSGSMALGVDNQAAIWATKAFVSKPGHYLMDKFHDDLRKLIPAHDERKLIVRWTPGHHGIPGNEAADEHAKMAA